MSEPSPRLAFWGTYDLSKPRVRLLLRAAKAGPRSILECHQDVWGGIRDKSQVRGLNVLFGIGLRYLRAYPRLLWRYLTLPKHDSVIIPYLGLLDVLVLWPFAYLRGTRIYWDVFISLYDTVVCDRALLRPQSPLAKILKGAEGLAARLADRCLLDTEDHAHYFAELHGLAQEKVDRLWVGAESEFFFPPVLPAPRRQGPLQVLFYGQFIPLHGIDVIIQAAHHAEQNPANGAIEWIIIGEGQRRSEIDRELSRLNIHSVRRVSWVEYELLLPWIHRADICLGVFGKSEKTGRVIPNKIYQALAANRPLITADTSAIRELMPEPPPFVRLIPPGSPVALAQAVWELGAAIRLAPETLNPSAFPLVDYRTLSNQLENILARPFDGAGPAWALKRKQT